MDIPRGDMFSDHHDPYRNPPPGNSAPWPSGDHRPHFPGGHHYNSYNNHPPDFQPHPHQNNYNNNYEYNHYHQGDYHYPQNGNHPPQPQPHPQPHPHPHPHPLPPPHPYPPPHFQQQQHHPPDQQHYEQYNQHVNSERNNSSCGGGFRSNGGGTYNSGRKRGFHHHARGSSPDPTGGGCHAKLYVRPVSRTATEDEVRALFQEHGNLLEIVLPKDKITGERHGYCFVKYTTFEEGTRAIEALQDRYTFPGELAPIKVRFAEDDRDRDQNRDRFVVQASDKLYIGGLHKHSSEKEIHEIFSAYGTIEDIYILRDEMKQIRGSAFVQYSRREMAMEAIKALNGNFKMRDSEQPLIVKFAAPKKHRTGETRSNHVFGGPSNGPFYQDPAVRPAPNLMVPMLPVSTNSQAQGVQWRNKEAAAPCITQQPHLPPPQLPQLPAKGFQSSHQAVAESQNQINVVHKSIQNPEQQDNSQVTRVETISNPPTMDSTAAPQSPHPITTECDWSEHTCPDGYKYYYNCITLESAWEKPEEFSLFKKHLYGQNKLETPTSQIHSKSPDCQIQQPSKNEEEKNRSRGDIEKHVY